MSKIAAAQGIVGLGTRITGVGRGLGLAQGVTADGIIGAMKSSGLPGLGKGTGRAPKDFISDSEIEKMVNNLSISSRFHTPEAKSISYNAYGHFGSSAPGQASPFQNFSQVDGFPGAPYGNMNSQIMGERARAANQASASTERSAGKVKDIKREIPKHKKPKISSNKGFSTPSREIDPASDPFLAASTVGAVGFIGGAMAFGGVASYTTGGSFIEGAVAGGMVGLGAAGVAFGARRAAGSMAPSMGKHEEVFTTFSQGKSSVAARRYALFAGAGLGGFMFGGNRHQQSHFNANRGNGFR